MESATAGRPTGRTDAPRRSGHVANRLTTETKASFKTSEFAMAVLVIAGILISALVIKGGDTSGTDEFIASQAWLYVAIVVVGYCIGRGARQVRQPRAVHG